MPPRSVELAAWRPHVLDIGFGMGEATAQAGLADPDRRVLAVEVHPAGIAALLRRLEDAGMDNVRVVEGDAVAVLEQLPEVSLDEARLFFPDPWPKGRHVKRRLLRPDLGPLLASRLAPDGFLHLVTDSPEYVVHARGALAGWHVEVIDRPSNRPLTGYERRALAAGRQVVDLIIRHDRP